MKPLDLKKAKFSNIDGIINIELKKKIPKKLYKYYSLNEKSKENLKNNTLFFTHPHLLNDLMDGNFMLWNIDELIKSYMEDTSSKENECELKIKILKQLINENLKYHGVLSLTKDYDNNLMWPHYTQENGFCIELETNSLLKDLEQLDCENYLYPISYIRALETINIMDYSTCYETNGNKEYDIKLPILYSLAVKDFNWKYEKEWRIFFTDRRILSNFTNHLDIIDDTEKQIQREELKKRNIKIKKNTIKNIILAPYFFNNDRFNKASSELDIEVYLFKQFDEINILKEFLRILKFDYNNRITQIDFLVNKAKNKLDRKIRYKIEILEIGESFVKIKRDVLKDTILKGLSP